MNHTQLLEVRRITTGWVISHRATKTPVTDPFKTEGEAKEVLDSWAHKQKKVPKTQQTESKKPTPKKKKSATAS